ncbi:MAG: nucleotidyltransferase domain-containing protein [Bacillota bacterium]
MGHGTKSLHRWNAVSFRDKSNLWACKATIRSVLPDAKLVLYGSRARGDAEPESDFDLLVLVPAPVSQATLQKLSDAIYDVELERGIVVSCLVCSDEEWNSSPWRVSPFRVNVEREGIVL